MQHLMLKDGLLYLCEVLMYAYFTVFPSTQETPSCPLNISQTCWFTQPIESVAMDAFEKGIRKRGHCFPYILKLNLAVAFWCVMTG